VKGFTGSLGFRLTVTTYVLVAVFLSIAGFTVVRMSQDSIKMGAVQMVQEMAEAIQIEVAMNSPVEKLGDSIAMLKVKKTGSVWIMDKDGYMLYNPDPLFREEYVKPKKKFGNVVVNLQYASPRSSGQGVFKEKIVDIAAKYDEGFGTYSQFGEKRILAFRTIPSRGLLVGVDEPVSSANSELERVKKYILYTALVSALLIMVFNFLAIRIIIRPYYREVEDLNNGLQQSNLQLENSNVKLAVSNKNLTTLHEIGLAMQQTLTLKDILDVIITGAHDVLGIDRINLMLPSADNAFLECRAAIGHGDESLDGVRVPLGDQGGALSAAYEKKEVLRFDDSVKIPQSLRLSDPYDKMDFLRSRAFIVVPLVVKDRPVGVIALDNKVTRRPITEAQANLMSIFANQAAVAVENARLYDQLRQKIDELDAKVDQLSILHQIGNSMQRVTNRDEALGFILRGILEGMGFDSVMVALFDREEDVLRGELALGLEEGAVDAVRVPLMEEENLLVMSVTGKRPVGIVHFSSDDLARVAGGPLQKDEYRESFNVALPEARLAAVAVPLIAREEVVGVVVVGRKTPPIIRRNEIELLMLYANTAGLTVERSDLYGRMNKDIESLEITDHVSRLFTYSYGQQRVQEELDKSTETGHPLSVMLMGIDDFKAYNDLCGHDVGDRSLAEIGDIVKTGIRASDFAYRYGGRLMVAVLPSTEVAAAVEMAEGILSRVRRQRFAGPEEELDQSISLSIGVMQKRAEDQIASEADLFKVLLGVLHRAEAEGGDRILTL
jgi:diguanylate cyclase (GGDEF)-like protein